MSTALLGTGIEPSTVSSRRLRRLLLVAYCFPPVGGAGVQRPVKWTKYLRRFGWDVTVLTTLNPSVPVRDQSLLADIPDDVLVVRAPTWEPDYQLKLKLIESSSTTSFSLAQQAKQALRGIAQRCVKLALQPDPQVLWNYNAIRAGNRLLREHRHDAILVTAPAYSSFFVGAALKRRFGLPLVLDYRDEWDLSGKYLENAQHDWISHFVQNRMQSQLLGRADAVVATTGRSTQNLADKLQALGRNIPCRCIYNGFDAEDFDVSVGEVSPQVDNDNPTVRLPESGTFRLVYTGTLWNLTDVEPLVQGIERLHSSQPELVRKLEFVCVGRKTPEQSAVLNRLRATSARLETIDYCDHSTALRWLRSADGLCLLLSNVPGAERVVPAKLFEYLAIRKDILTIAPAGETSEIIRQFFPEGHIVPDDQTSIAGWLETRLKSVDDAKRPSAFNVGNYSESGFLQYSRESQTCNLAILLDSLVETRKN